MKKLACVFALFCVFVGGAIAQGDNPDNLQRPIRAEVALNIMGINGLDVRAAYTFPINDVFRWDLGLDINFLGNGVFDLFDTFTYAGSDTSGESEYIYFGMSFDILAMASFWFWDFYLSYGLGIGINTVGGSAFLPFDIRLGWEPASRKNNLATFKIEAGLFATTLGTEIYKYKYYYETHDTYEYRYGRQVFDRSEVKYVLLPGLNVGVVFRF